MTLIRSAPVSMFKGSPLYSLYLKTLGAKLGHNAVIESRSVPVCTDLIAIGDNTILRKDSTVLGFRAEAGYIHTGPVRIGRDAFVGEASVLDIDTEMGDGSQLGHSSSLQQRQSIPARRALAWLSGNADHGRLLHRPRLAVHEAAPRHL